MKTKLVKSYIVTKKYISKTSWMEQWLSVTKATLTRIYISMSRFKHLNKIRINWTSIFYKKSNVEPIKLSKRNSELQVCVCMIFKINLSVSTRFFFLPT